MRLTVTYTSAPAARRAGYRACFRTIYALSWVAAVLCLVVGVTASNVPVLIYGAVAVPLVEWQIRRRLRATGDGDIVVTHVLDDSDFRVSSGRNTSVRPWADFTELRRVGRFWVFRTRTGARVWIPTGALDEAQTEQLQEIGRAQGLLG